MQLCLRTMYTLHVHAVISQLMTLFVPTYSTTNLEIPQNIRFKSFLRVHHTAGILVFWYFFIFGFSTNKSIGSPIVQSAQWKTPQKHPKNDALNQMVKHFN